MGKSTTKRYVIDDSQIREICKAAADAGVKAYRKEKEKEASERMDKVLNSSKTLIKNYRQFKEMCDKSVYDKETAGNELDMIASMMTGKFWNYEVEISSIKDKVARTRLIMDHVDTMLKVFEHQCYASPNDEDARMYRVIDGLYLGQDVKTVEDICLEENVTVSTVYRDQAKAFSKLAILFFGIDGVRL